MAVFTLFGCRPSANPNGNVYPADWTVYYNPRYHYEIHYPKDLELHLTGPENQRDGASLRISPKEYQAINPVLDVFVYPGKTMQELAATFTYSRDDLLKVVKDLPESPGQGKRIEYWFRETNQLFSFVIIRDQVAFAYLAHPSQDIFPAEEAEEVIDSFRFLK